MKRIDRNFLVLLVSLLALSAFTFAQDATYHVNVSVPFEFHAADQQLPAGAYQFTVNYESHTVSLRNQETGHSITLLAIPDDGDRSGQTVVEFDVVGDNHSLADLKTANSGISFSAKTATMTATKRHETVAIVATLR
jgi:hypothetical protein